MPEVDHGFRQEQLTNLAASDGDNMSAGCNGAQLSSRADLESDPDSRHHAAHVPAAKWRLESQPLQKVRSILSKCLVSQSVESSPRVWANVSKRAWDVR
jgi:hypothetical protein